MFRKITIIAAGLIALFSLTSFAHAGRGFVQYSYGPHVTKIADLPSQATGGTSLENFSLGWRHERVELFWMPIWGSTEGNYVFYTEAGDGWRSVPVPPEMIISLGGEMNIDLTDGTPISFFSLIWGWIIYGPLALLAIKGFTKGNKRKAQPDNHQVAAIHQELANFQPAPKSNQTTISRPMSPQATPAGGPVTFGKRR